MKTGRILLLSSAAALLSGCAITPRPVEVGWICGTGMFLEYERNRVQEVPCTGTKDLALAGEVLPPDGD